MHVKTRLDPEVHAAALIAASNEGLSLTEYLNALLQADLEARPLAKKSKSVSNQGDGNANSDCDGPR